MPMCWMTISLDDLCCTFQPGTQATGLDEVVKSIADDEAATLFLPTDIAFTFFMPEANTTVEEFLMIDDGDYALDVISYHLVSGIAIDNLTEAAMGNGTMVEAANGEMIYITNGIGEMAILVDKLGRNTDAFGTMEKYNVGSICVYASPRVLLPTEATNLAELFDALPGSYGYIHGCMDLLASQDGSMGEMYTDLLYSNSSNVTVLAALNEAWSRYAIRMNISLSMLLDNVTSCEAIVEASIVPSMAYHTTMLEIGMELDLMYEGATWTIQLLEGRTYTYIYMEGSDAFGVRNPFFLDMDLKGGAALVQGLDMLTPPFNLGFGDYYNAEYYTDNFSQDYERNQYPLLAKDLCRSGLRAAAGAQLMPRVCVTTAVRAVAAVAPLGQRRNTAPSSPCLAAPTPTLYCLTAVCPFFFYPCPRMVIRADALPNVNAYGRAS
eukprot:366028-Chlamydomonas_euryale.AAC.31